LIASLGKSYRDSETQRIDSLKKQIEQLNAGQLPGYSAPSAQERLHANDILQGVENAENDLVSYSNSCDRDEWMHAQIQSTVSRADEIEALTRQMYQAQDEEQRRQAQLALERARKAAEDQRQRLAQALRDHPTPDEFRHDQTERGDQHNSNGNASRPQRDAFPLDRPQRDMIGGVMNSLEQEAHEGPGRQD
jgi:hypothetical protein